MSNSPAKGYSREAGTSTQVTVVVNSITVAIEVAFIILKTSIIFPIIQEFAVTGSSKASLVGLIALPIKVTEFVVPLFVVTVSFDAKLICEAVTVR